MATSSEFACEFCKRQPDIIVDGKTTQGPWAWMCVEDHKIHGVGLGTGKGQKYQIIEGKHLKKLEG